MRKETYENKLSDYSIQIISAKEKDYVMQLLWRKDINNVLLAMMKKDEASENLYTRMRSTGGQPTRFMIGEGA